MNNNELEQQLLATQEAYQRVVAALNESNSYIRSTDNGGFSALPVIKANKKALANPPSLEALENDREKRKLTDEIAVLGLVDNASLSYLGEYMLHVRRMIAERKAKLEKMK